MGLVIFSNNSISSLSFIEQFIWVLTKMPLVKSPRHGTNSIHQNQAFLIMVKVKCMLQLMQGLINFLDMLMRQGFVCLYIISAQRKMGRRTQTLTGTGRSSDASRIQFTKLASFGQGKEAQLNRCGKAAGICNMARMLYFFFVELWQSINDRLVIDGGQLTILQQAKVLREINHFQFLGS